MKSYVRRATEVIEALGFENRATDVERNTRKRVYVHPWHADEQPIRIWEGGSQQAWTAAARTAAMIVGDAKAAPIAAPDRKGQIQRDRDKSRIEEQRKAAAALDRAAANLRRAKREVAALPAAALLARSLSPAQRRSLIAKDNERRFYEDLMKPGA